MSRLLKYSIDLQKKSDNGTDGEMNSQDPKRAKFKRAQRPIRKILEEDVDERVQRVLKAIVKMQSSTQTRICKKSTRTDANLESSDMKTQRLNNTSKTANAFPETLPLDPTPLCETLPSTQTTPRRGSCPSSKTVN